MKTEQKQALYRQLHLELDRALDLTKKIISQAKSSQSKKAA